MNRARIKEQQVVGGDPTPGNKNNGDSWEEFDNVGSSFLGEGFLTGSTPVLSSSSLSLGSVFATGGAEDLSFTYTATNNGLDGIGVLTGTVEYVAGGFSADFDGDGDVDGADLDDWKGSFGPTNGADQDGDSDGLAATAWKRSGNPTATTVPEPSAALWWLAVG